MPAIYDGAVAILTGTCTVEDAEPMLDWLRQAVEPAVDMAGLAAAHSAVVQLLFATAPRIIAMPTDPLLADALAAGLPAQTLPPGTPSHRANPPQVTA